jgi:hypothetical protein
MPILFECSNCNAKMRAPDGSAGRKTRCPTCNSIVTIGGEAAERSREADEDEPRERGLRTSPEAPARRPRDEDEDEPRPRPRREREEDEDDRPRRRRDYEEADRDRPRRRRREGPEEPGFSITSMVLGIVALPLVCCWPLSSVLAVTAIVFGILGINRGGRGMALAGIICAGIALVLIVCLLLFGFGLNVLGSMAGR